MSLSSLKRGFTLIELLLVIGIIAILAAIVIVAINPTKQLGDARNAQRRSDVTTILNAVYQYSIDNQGTIPAAITTAPVEICRSTNGINCTGLVNLNVLTGAYLVALPVDPQAASPATPLSTRYTIFKTGIRLTVAAPGCEGTACPISVTR